jgi:hypothetical protein
MKALRTPETNNAAFMLCTVALGAVNRVVLEKRAGLDFY